MRHPWCLLFGFALCLALLVGCGSSSSGPAQPADLDEINQFVADNPDLNLDEVDDDMEEDDE